MIGTLLCTIGSLCATGPVPLSHCCSRCARRAPTIRCFQFVWPVLVLHVVLFAGCMLFSVCPRGRLAFHCADAQTHRCRRVIPCHARSVFAHASNHLPGVVAPCRNSGVARCVVLSQALVREKCSGTCSKCHVAAASMFVFAVWGTRLAGSMMLMPRSIACSLACMHPNGSRT